GTAITLDPAVDWVIPSYRELPALLRQGMPLERVFAGLMGKAPSARIPEGVNVLPNQVSLATQLPQAVGLAWGLKLQHRPGIVMAYLGDGAASEGDFHEACNLAGVTGAPIVFVLQNNQWAISTPRAYQSAARHFSDRAAGYGFPGRVVDGNDLLAVYEVTKEAADRARRGEGPTLIEAVTYRMSFHNTTDNPSRYQDPKDLEEARLRDPVDRVEAYLRERGMWTAETEKEYREAVAREVEDAVAEAQKAPPPQPSQIFDNVYAELTPRLASQRD